uniref:Histone acetyltransferase n=1 Tax=Piliocolobus tephrosceles TaxID=591936 RepID=A0A8C9LL41_9PRIM
MTTTNATNTTTTDTTTTTTTDATTTNVIIEKSTTTEAVAALNESTESAATGNVNLPLLTHSSSSTPKGNSKMITKGIGSLKSKEKAYSNSSVANSHISSSGSKHTKGGINKVRSTGKTINASSKFNDSYALIFPNAIPVKQVLWGLDPLNKVWRYCSVVYARPQKKNSKKDFPLFYSLNMQKNDIQNKVNNEINTTNLNMQACDYDYYVHWENFDRRLDCWLAYDQLRLLDNYPDDGNPIIKNIEKNASDQEHLGIDKEYLKEHEENTKLKTINQIRFGSYLVDTWYFSPYPKEYQNIDVLYICEFCLCFFKLEKELIRHIRRCEIRHPPGNEIYRNERNSIFEIDGNYFRIYCENLCFLSKLFLDHKTLKHRVNLFLFYVITEIDEYGYHITGYFSKEKYSKNNVSCILTLPQHQKKGYGKFLINFSYFLSQTEHRTGTPERPLSDLGVASYMAYWYETLLKVLLNYNQISVQELSELTSIEINDILTCLEEKDIFKTAPNGDIIYYINPKQMEFVLSKLNQKNYDLCKSKLHWVSYDYHLAL